MTLFLLERTGETDYDEQISVVVRASDEVQARDIASRTAGDEKASTWFAPRLTSCTAIERDGEPGLICQDFHAG